MLFLFRLILSYISMIESKKEKSVKDWKKILTKEQYHILREKGTDPPFRGKYWNHKDEGIFYCSGCGNPLFNSETKFKSGTGWPSFYKPIEKDNISIKEDVSHGMVRTEVLCNRCGGHLGHVFKDGPQPTGLRYCINSTSLNFEL